MTAVPVRPPVRVEPLVVGGWGNGVTAQTSSQPVAGGSGAGCEEPPEEIFAPIVGFPGYFVGDRGTVLSTKRCQARELQGQVKSNGYVSVNLSAPGYVHKTVTVHPLVAYAFVGPRPEGHVVCHWDGVRVNNDVRNLRWGTPSQNTRDAIRHGTVKPDLIGGHQRFWTHCVNGHRYSDENTRRRPDGTRRCIACEQGYRRRRAARPAGSTETAA